MKKILYITLILITMFTNKSFAESILKDNFQNSTQWKFISDNVMGGVSTGSINYVIKEGNSSAYLSGNVSTKNNGGFIQIRRSLKDIDLSKAKYIKITAKGNNQKYFLHLRTSGTILPWQYYQISFEVKEEYKEYILQIKEFKKSGSFQPSMVNSKSISSVAVVAYGRDHKADIHVKEISFHE
ncbi:CIA30 family protein [Gammaproteobacteria bacterium]|nr:CIA30 family protein [Gammaproteobacteria bacterium]